MVNVCHAVIRAACRNASSTVINASEQVLCLCVPAGTPGGLRRFGWTSINSTTTLRGRQPRARPLAGLCITLSSSSLVTQHRQAWLCVRQVRGSLLNDLLYTSDVFIHILYVFIETINEVKEVLRQKLIELPIKISLFHHFLRCTIFNHVHHVLID